jgi:hypothetical protein
MFRTAVPLLALAAAPLAATPLAAAEPPRPAALDALTACRAVADDAARLACYDRAAGALAASVEKKEVVVIDQQEVRKTRRSLFGFSLPKLTLFNDDDEARDGRPEKSEFAEIESKVTSLRKLRTGHYSFTIEDGAVWQTTEYGSILPKVGDTVTIKKGTLGGYFIIFQGSRAVRGIRTG